MADPILQTDHVSKKYSRRLAVDRLSLVVQPGDIFGFLGQNGAGKSTAIRMALGLVRPTSGNVRLFGYDMARSPLAALKRVGAIVEAPAFYENFSGFENLRMFAAISGGATRKQIEETLDLLNLLPRARDAVRTYSHGMRQRLGIAQALLPRPDLVILDEPTDGLDPQGIREIRLLLPRLRDELGLTILISSHLLHEVERICNVVAIINEGRLVYQGAVDGLVGSGRVVRIKAEPMEEAFRILTCSTDLSVRRNGSNSLYVTMREEHIASVNGLLVQNQIRVSELSMQHTTLEDVFLTLTK